jgi:colanic acid biosynthesis glycosyl transferase WcaI
MRLLVVSQYFWPEDFRVNDFVVGMRERGHEVTVLTGLPNYPGGKVFDAFQANPRDFDRFHDGVEVLRVPVIPRGDSKIGLMLNYLSFALTGMILGPWKLRRRAFDAIFVFQGSPITSALPAVVLRWIKRAPHLMWILDVWPDTLPAVGAIKNPRILSLVGLLVRFIYRNCYRILVQSRAFWTPVLRDGGTEAQLAYFPNWIEPTFRDGLDGVAPAPEVTARAGDFTIMFAGNIGESQDMSSVLDAAEAVRDLPNVRWLIVGDGRAADALRSGIAERGLQDRVILLGRHPTDRMPSFFAGADALLVSLRAEPIFAMTIPGKVQSYMAAGKPVLGMIDGEGGRVIEESGGGFAAPAGDGVALAEAVRRMAALSADDRAAMGARARDYAMREFDRERLFDDFVIWAREARDRMRGQPRPIEE